MEDLLLVARMTGLAGTLDQAIQHLCSLVDAMVERRQGGGCQAGIAALDMDRLFSG
ncbi:hypothetical protein [Cyanobium sp. Lug-B]|uniref:hypothetical protein n=1 Tax=Cyanobium sp. Lug-B TaxID=2823716 RepID=UPI0020CDEDFF|nr:hypothetical protein [Cyanobium sp. Lug-B]MCP9796090.1 hypothetical protein [Cyanobium sp. Lug-B]